MKKVCALVLLEWSQIFPAGRQTSTTRCGCVCVGRGVGGGGRGGNAGLESEYSMAFCWQQRPLTVTQEPLAFTTPCSAAILPP